MLVDYNSNTHTWSGTRQIDSGKGQYKKSSSRCSYPNSYTYGPKGKLHATWVWREGSGSANHDLVYVYSEDKGRTWLNNKGEVLKRPPYVKSPDITAVSIDEKYGLMNTHGQTIDTKGINEEVFYVYFPIDLGKFELLQKWEEISEDFRTKINLNFYSLDFLTDAENNSWLMESNSASGLGCYSLAAGYEAIYRDFHEKNPPVDKMKVVNMIKDTYVVELKNYYPREYNKSIASK